MKNIRVGCCGFPRARSEYYKAFQLVEVQQTFYHPPALKTVEKWRSDAPGDFEFTLKAWQLITHEFKSPNYRRSSPLQLRSRVQMPKIPSISGRGVPRRQGDNQLHSRGRREI